MKGSQLSCFFPVNEVEEKVKLEEDENKQQEKDKIRTSM